MVKYNVNPVIQDKNITMNARDVFPAQLYSRLEDELNEIGTVNENVVRMAELSLLAVRSSISKLRDFMLQEEFSSRAEEIHFFKITKPKFYRLLIYYFNLLEIELRRPAGSQKLIIRYFEKEQLKLDGFFDKHRDFYQYYRSCSTILDDKFFIRGYYDILPALEIYGLDTDPRFTTSFDFIVSKMLANELLKQYIDDQLQHIKAGREIQSQMHPNKLSWTASKVSLIELLYGLHSAGVFGNGQVGLNDIANFFETVFEVKLGNYYRTFQEIRIRKKNRTQFIDELKDQLIKKMDFSDENPSFH